MKLLIIIFLSTACTTSSQQVPGSMKFLEQDAKLRRQGLSYSTSIIHQDPKHPNQHAESSINVDFDPQKIKPSSNQPNTAFQNYNNNNNNKAQQKRPKAYNYNNNKQLGTRKPFQYTAQETSPHVNHLPTSSVNNPPFNSQPSQSFNVGYSVSFTGGNGQKTQPPRTFTRPKLENAEIITGSRKETVQRPRNNFQSNHALIDLKKQKLSGIKPKGTKFNSNKDNDQKNFIGNLAPKTQQYLSYLNDASPVDTPNIKIREQLDEQNAQTVQGIATAWTNLSPSVEIYHSKELPQESQVKHAKGFDHAAALGNSQGFDYSNALEGQIKELQQEFNKPFLDLMTNNIGQSEVNQQSQGRFNVYPNLRTNLEATPLVVPYNNNNFASLSTVPLNNLQISQNNEELLPKTQQGAGISNVDFSGYTGTLLSPNLKNLGNLPQYADNSQALINFPNYQTQSAGIPQKMPIDMSLVREPVLVAGGNTAPTDPNIISIPFDTTLLEAMKQKLFTSTPESFDVSKGQVQLPLQENVENAGHQFQSQGENLQVQPIQQNVAFQDQGFPQFQGQQVQQSQQYNVYENPQPHSIFSKKGFDKYFDRYFDPMLPQESNFETISVRYPTVNINNNNRIRATKGIEIHTDLQPPPMQIARHRRMFLG